MSEVIHVEGVSDSLPNLYDGQIAIYWCNKCGTLPKVKQGEIAVSVVHDACQRQIGRELSELALDLLGLSGRRLAKKSK